MVYATCIEIDDGAQCSHDVNIFKHIVLWSYIHEDNVFDVHILLHLGAIELWDMSTRGLLQHPSF